MENPLVDIRPFIIEYLERKFKHDCVISSGGTEFITNSVFQEDHKHHMSINLETGLWQDFKSGKAGNFIQLYSYLEGISYKQAERAILVRSISTPVKITSYVELKQDLFIEEEFAKFTPITVETYTSNEELEELAWAFLYERKLFGGKHNTYYLCREGAFSSRLIIPFINSKGRVLFFQARALKDQKPKYLNPNKDYGINTSDILYPYSNKEPYLVICEGPVDAISLQIQGVNATCTLGCHVSHSQIKQLRSFPGKIISGYNNDAAGVRGLSSFNHTRKMFRMPEIHYCIPPKGFKDWNDMHVKEVNLKDFIEKSSKVYDDSVFMLDMLLNNEI